MLHPWRNNDIRNKRNTSMFVDAVTNTPYVPLHCRREMPVHTNPEDLLGYYDNICE